MAQQYQVKDGQSQRKREKHPHSYTADLSQFLSSLGIIAPRYAGHTQIRVHGPAVEAISLMQKPLQTLEELCIWMKSNRLLLSPWKIQFHMAWYLWKDLYNRSALFAALFPWGFFSTRVHDFGVTLDQEFTFSEHLESRTCVCYLCQICTISLLLQLKLPRPSIVHAFVWLRVDYVCNDYSFRH